MSTLKKAALILYAAYAWLAFLVLGGTTLLLLIVLPGLKLRRTVGSLGSRLWLIAVGIRVDLEGAATLPTTPSVIVANHQSYIDGVLLKAILPKRFSFVIKKEMVRVPLAGLLLRRLGAEFVDRFNRNAGAMDARRLMRTASGGGSLVFFPEGTFTAKPGLGRFHGGAFAIASRARMPIVPLSIHGARNVFPPETILLRPGRVRITVHPAIAAPEEMAANAVATLQREQSRAAILRALNEPDLDGDDGVASLAAERSRT